MKKALAVLLAGLIFTGIAAAATDTPNPGQTPGSPLYGLDRFSESLELAVARAPVIGSEELEAKVRANHAAERLSEAERMADRNRSEKVEKLMQDYSENMNRSVEAARKANNSELSKRLGNVSDSNVEVLERVKQKVPEQAQKGIEKAIENSQRSREKLRAPPQARGKVPSNPGKGEVSDLEEKLNASDGQELPEIPNRSGKDGDLPDSDNLTFNNPQNNSLEELEESSNLSNSPDGDSGNSITGEATGGDEPEVREPEMPDSSLDR